MKRTLIYIALIVLAGFHSSSQADTRWVADSMYLPMRSGMGSQYRIIANLKTGTELTLISEDADGKWAEVKTRSGKTGFVLTQHLLTTPTAAQRLANAETELAKLKKERDQLKQQLINLESTNAELAGNLTSSDTRANQLQQELDELERLSQGAITLNQSHKELLHNHELIQTEVDVLKEKNSRLQSDERNTFFLYGAGSVLLGVIIALVAPHLRKRKGFSEWAN